MKNHQQVINSGLIKNPLVSLNKASHKTLLLEGEVPVRGLVDEPFSSRAAEGQGASTHLLRPKNNKTLGILSCGWHGIVTWSLQQMSFSHDTCLYNRCHFPKHERRFVEQLPRTWMNVTSKREHFKRKDRLPVAAFFRGDSFVFGDIKLMEPTLNSSQDWGLKLGARFFQIFSPRKKKRMKQKDGELHITLQPEWCLNPPQKNHALVVPQPSIHLARGWCWDL